MGLIRSLARLLFTRVIPLLVLIIAIFVGWLAHSPVPEGKFQALVVPVIKGAWPPIIVGHGKMTGTPPVPDDMLPEPRPENELFLELPGGHFMPQNGLGMCCRATAHDDVLVERTILWYSLMGGRHIDTAHLYLNHEAIGRGIKAAINRGVPREEIFVTTKVNPGYYGRNSTMEAVSLFLKELDLEYIDLILMHSPNRLPGVEWVSSSCSKSGLSKSECRKETYLTLSELREKGAVRNIGVSNFPVRVLKEIQSLENAAPIANNQINFNPWIAEGWMETYKYCMEHGITVTSYGSLGGSMQHNETYTLGVLADLASKYEKSVAQIMLRWAVQMGTIVIPGTGNPKHMRENLAVSDFVLSEDDMKAIDSLRTVKETKKFFVMEDGLMDDK